MTRTEKWFKYREEIKHTVFLNDEKSTKERSSDLVDRILIKENRETSALSFDEVMNAHKLYEDGVSAPKKRKMNSFKKKQILFAIISAIIVIALALCLVLVGIKLFGG